MSKNPSKDKGARGERWLTKWLCGMGWKAKKVIGSGAFSIHDDRLEADIQIDMAEHGKPYILNIEVKTWKKPTGFKQVIDLLGDNDIFMLKLDYSKNPLIIMHGSTFEDLSEIIYKKKVDKRIKPIPIICSNCDQLIKPRAGGVIGWDGKDEYFHHPTCPND